MEMAFRTEIRIGALLALATALLAGQPLRYPVRHQHWRKGAAGEIIVSEDGLSFRESGKKGAQHSRQWKYEDIQQIVVSPTQIRILTYEDMRRRLGRDREFEFDQLPKDFATKTWPLFRRRLDQRFVAAMADPDIQPLWQAPVKLLHSLGGTEGVLLVAADRLVYRTKEGDASRTWRLPDIDTVSSSGPFDLTLTTFEKPAWHHGGSREVRFQLKQTLSEDRYQDLWRMVNRSKRVLIGDKQ
jgi:hypothetical protein